MTRKKLKFPKEYFTRRSAEMFPPCMDQCPEYSQEIFCQQAYWNVSPLHRSLAYSFRNIFEVCVMVLTLYFLHIFLDYNSPFAVYIYYKQT